MRWAAVAGAAGVLIALVAWTLVISSRLLTVELRQDAVSYLQQVLGRPVALGSVEGDLLHGIELRNLVITEPGGVSRGVAFSADRVRISFDLRNLLLRWRGGVGSIARVDLVNPFLVVRRNAEGAWNLADLIAGHPGLSVSQFHAFVAVRGGNLSYSDALDLRTAPFLTHVTHIHGALDFRHVGQVPVDLIGLGSDGADAALSGRYLPDADTYDLDVATRKASVRHWAGYLVRITGLRWQGGRFDGRMHVLVTPASAPEGITVDYAGTLHLFDAEAEYRPTHLAFQRIEGDLTLDSDSAATAGLTLEANGAPLWVRGDVAYSGGPWLDLVVRSSGLDLVSVRALFFPGARLGLTGEASGEAWMTGPLGAPYLDGDVTSARGHLNRQAFGALRTRFQYAGGVLVLRDLSADMAGGRVSGDAVLDFSQSDPSYQFAATAEDVDASSLRSVGLPAAEGLTGPVSGGLVGATEQGRLRLMAGVTMGPGSVQGTAIDGLTALFWDDGGTVSLDYLGVHRGLTTVFASGRLEPAGTLDLDVAGLGLPLAEVGQRARLAGFPLSGLADIEGHLGGTAAAPVLAGVVTAADGHLGPLAFDFARGDLTLTSGSVSSRHLDLQDGAARYRISGGIAFHPLAAQGLRVDAEGVDAGRLSEAVGSPRITGTLTGRVSVNGLLEHATASGEITLAHGSVAGERVDRVEAQFTGQGPIFHLQSVEAQISNSHVHAAGTVDLRGPVDVRMWADDLRLADFNTALGLGVQPQGTIFLAGGVRGTFTDPEVWGDLSSLDLSIYGQTFQASGVVDYQSGVLHFMPLELTQGAGRYRLMGDLRFGARPSADLTVDVSEGQVSTIVGASGTVLPVPLDGTINGQVTLSGPLSDPAARVTLTLQDARMKEYPIGAGVADLTLSHGAIEIQRFQIHPPQGEVDVRGTVDLRGMSAVEVSARDLDPNFLRPLLRLDRPLEGRLNFTVQFSGLTRNPTAGLSVEAVDAGIPGVLADRIIGLAYYKDGVLHIEDGSIAKGPHKVVIQGAVPMKLGSLAFDPGGPLRLHLALQDADLSLLTLLVPAIHDARGTVVGEVEVGGTVGAPLMAGYVRSSGGEVRYASLRTTFENVSADIEFSQAQILVRDLSATLGGGPLRAHGTVSVSNLRPDTVALDFSADHATVDIPDLYAGRVDAALAITGPAVRPTLSGMVTLSEGQVLSAGGFSHAGVARGANLALDVTVLARGNNLRYEDGAVSASLGGSIHLGGTLVRPVLAGRVTAVDGTIMVLGTPFTVTEGSVVFPGAPGLEPEISARAQAVYGDNTRVFMEVTGPISHPDPPRLSSDPPMTQAEILTRVTQTAGVTGAPGTVIGQQLLGRVVLGSFGQTLQHALRLDEFTISYDPQNPITLRIGKFIVHNLYLSVAEVLPQPASGALPPPGSLTRLSATGQPYGVYGVEYFLSPSVFVTYNIDTVGDSGVFLLTRIPF